MSRGLNANPRTVANSSGFPLQIRVAEIANSSRKWEVYAEEHPWCSSSTQNEGFIDLVLLDKLHNVQSIVVECKRVMQTVWVFLIDKPKPTLRTHIRLWISDHGFSRWDQFGWSDFQAEPACHESKYCAIPGQAHGRHNLIEKTASELVDSIEALATQEKELHDRPGQSESSFRRVYIPVIVTTAELQVACFSPDSISIKDGTLPENVAFSSVPYVRFRKALNSFFEPSPHETLLVAHQKAERSVFIVNSAKFDEFLNIWEIFR